MTELKRKNFLVEGIEINLNFNVTINIHKFLIHFILINKLILISIVVFNSKCQARWFSLRTRRFLLGDNNSSQKNGSKLRIIEETIALSVNSVSLKN
ncbi:hypothetical protein Mgra_00006933 [Meloidogyne graminicola]|uniref:Uncharacterized protein n=1 Tax=Meloidogyne graminicola TaxID=189291 RepID=A0A8S9ZKB6_9BILA|nr:hypothetical protein Mgra_00006933 [Meloidogyne graminicola]